jgi:ceramide glucosyltransferase
MILDILMLAVLLMLFFWLVVFPAGAWIVVSVLYPRRIRSLGREPDFPVNVIVPCKGAGPHLQENLGAIASQDYPDFRVTFVTDTADDAALPAISAVARDNPRASHLVAGMAERCAQKSHVQLAAIAADNGSQVFVICDSDLRPEPHWLREMVRPFVDGSVSVTTSHRWIEPGKLGAAQIFYTLLGGYYTMYLATPFLAWVWGGCFAISRKAFDEMGIAAVWGDTLSDDVTLRNRLAECKSRPFFVPRAVTASHETHASLGRLLKWYTRQSLTGKLYTFGQWLLGIFVQTVLCAALLASLGLLAGQAATATLDHRALFFPLLVVFIMLGGILAKLPYLRRRDVPLWCWILMPIPGQFVITYSFWRSAFQRKYTWGSATYIVGRRGRVERVIRRSA